MEHACKSNKTWVDGPLYDGADDLADGAEYDGQQPYFATRCYTCDEVLEWGAVNMADERRNLPWGAKWSDRHRAWVFPLGGAPSMKDERNLQ